MADRLCIAERQGLAVAAILSRRSATGTDIGHALGMAMSGGPSVSRSGALLLLGTGPSSWLAVAEAPDAGWFEHLSEALGSSASLSDQSSGYVVWRLAGSAVRTLLQRGAAIDFDPSAFAPGSVATTMIAHIGVIIWQVDDAPTFDVAVFRSFAPSFRRWLEATAAAL